MKRSIVLFLVGGLVGLLLVTGYEPKSQPIATAAMQEGAEYTVTLASTWTAANHPFEYPEAGC